jgi:hypothetical protein
MKRYRLRWLTGGLFVVALLSWLAEAKKRSDAAAVRIPVTEFTQNQKVIVGLLGVPLGTVVEIETTLVAGSAIPDALPNLARTFLLSVEKVNGVALSQPKIIDFIVYSEAKLPASYEDLPSSKTHASKLTMSELEAALAAEARQYVGSRHRLAVYEAGRFDGVPEKIPEDCMPWSGSNFGYHPYLVVLNIREAGSPPLEVQRAASRSAP